MKFILLISLSFLCILFLSGCSEDSTPQTPNNNGNSQHTGTISNPRQVTNEGYHPRFSPDGSKIVYTIWHSSLSEASLHLYDIASDSTYTIVSRRAGDLSPEWSPDGKKIIFDARDGSDISQIYEWEMDSNTINKISNYTSHAFQPSYSHDGSRIALAYLGALYIRELNTGTTTKIPGTEDSNSPVWTVNDSQIIYAYDPNYNNMSDIFIINTDGTNKVQITNYSGRDSRPRVSSDGKFILYEYEKDNNVHPVFYFFDTGEHISNESLTEAHHPDISKDLTKITYAANGGIVIADLSVK